MYNVPNNRLVESFNKTLCKLLEKVVSKSEKDWHEWIGNMSVSDIILNSYSIHTLLLMYGVEAVIVLACRIPSLRIAIQEGLTDDENAKL